MPTATVRWLGPSGAVIVGAVVVACFVPMLDVLGYEFSVLLSVLISTIGAIRVAWRTDPAARLWHEVARHALDLLGVIAIATLIALLNMVRVRNCEPLVGLMYVAIFGVGAIPLAVALPVAFRSALGRRGSALGVILAVVASTVAALHTLYAQPAIVAYSWWAGYFAGSIYDEALVSVLPHITWRGFNALCALTLLLWVARRRSPGAPRTAAAVLGVLLCAGLWTMRGDLGWQRDREWVIDALGGRAQTEHFDIYYDAAHFDDRELALLLYDHEAWYRQHARFFGIEPADRLSSFVYGSAERKGAFMGGRRTLVAKIWLGEMHIVWDGIGDGMLGHEMAHLFLRDAGRGPLHVSSADGVLPIMALVEGAAGAAAWDADDLDEHAWSAAMRRLDLAEPIEDLLGPAGFWSRNSDRGYTLTSSFVRWLIETEGPARFVDAYRDGDFARAYGQSLGALTARWHAFLDSYPLDPGLLELARFRFDRPSIFGRVCGRSIATRFDTGQQLATRREFEAARRCFEGILTDDPGNVAYRVRIARALWALGDADGALTQVAWLLDEAGAGRAAQGQANELRGDIAWSQGDEATAAGAYAAAAESLLLFGDQRRLRAKLEAIELGTEGARAASSAVRRALATVPAPADRAVVAELIDEQATAPLLAYLAGLRLVGTDSPMAVELLTDAVERPGLQPVHRLWALRSLALQRVSLGQASGCDTWEQVLEAASVGHGVAAEARRWLDRCSAGSLPNLDAPPGAVE